MNSLQFLFSSQISFVPVDLGTHTVRVPVFQKKGKVPGTSLLITAGMDGDEYAGIAAAYELVKRCMPSTSSGKKGSLGGQFNGTLTIIPIVNIPGFELGISKNPLDGKFPKFIYPGDLHGSPTERLVHWLVTAYVTQADFWVDLHGGAHDEALSPFVWAWKSGVTAVDDSMAQLLETLDAPRVLFDEAKIKKVTDLAKQGKRYLLTESGERGVIHQKDIDWHVRWVEMVMKELGMTFIDCHCPYRVNEESSTKQSLKYCKDRHSLITKGKRLGLAMTKEKPFHHVSYLSVPFSGLWAVDSDVLGPVKKGESVGILQSLDGKSQKIITASVSGQYLWKKIGGRAVKGEDVGAIGY